MRSLLPLLFLTAGGLAACRTVEHTHPTASTGEIRVASPARAWELVGEDDEVAGMVIFFRAHGAPGDSLYMVRNVWHQDLGMIDALGRAYRYLPHHREPAWVGTGTVGQGAERILSAEGCRMVEVVLPEPGTRPMTPGEVDRLRLETRSGVPGTASAPADS